MPALRICRAMDSLPASIASSRRSFVNHALILERARGDLTKLSQSRLGAAFSPLLVTTSTTSPLASGASKETNFPFTFAPIHLLPTSVCTVYAKSTGVDPAGSAITLPLGVKTNTSGVRRSNLRASRNSVTSDVSCCHSCSCLSQSMSGESADLDAEPSLYFQCAAIPYSARRCIS